MLDEDQTSPAALLAWIRRIADEASDMQLTRTLAVLQQAMETCRTEAVMKSRPNSSALH